MVAPGNVEHTANDHAAGFAAGMRVHSGNHSSELHQIILRPN